MDLQTKNLLLQSINADRLVVLCGAGLSMAVPSELPPAWELAEICHERHCDNIDPSFDPSTRHDLGAIAKYFANEGSLITHFIRELVPWEKFLGRSNPGHEALADFLVCRAIYAVISSNYDQLIEMPARKNGADLQVSLDGDEPNIHSSKHSPLLKFHGCVNRNRDHTVWTESQLTDDLDISERLQKNRTWMEANLREKDILVIGFWSDWSYLNNVIGAAFENVTPLSFTVVDPSEIDALEVKAPELWAKGHGEGVNFMHVQASGSDFLDELRIEFSKSFMRRVFAEGKTALKNEFDIECEPVWLDQPNMSSNEHYKWRRDAEGVGPNKAPLKKIPEKDEILGFFHLLLRKEGAIVNEDGYELDNQAIRVINGSGHFLSTMQELLIEPPALDSPDMIICVGSTDSGLPGHVIRTGIEGDFL